MARSNKSLENIDIEEHLLDFFSSLLLEPLLKVLRSAVKKFTEDKAWVAVLRA